MVLEGGMGGHMKHPIDYEDFTGNDLIQLVEDIFTGKIENMKEKLDGTNLNAYRDTEGNTVFIRNQTDLNSEKGGMSLEEISVRYFDKPNVADNFIKAAKVIEKVFERVPVKFFNPSKGVKVIVNCECISAGKTNAMIYQSDRVAFHGTSTYTLDSEKGRWELTDAHEGIPAEISKAAEGIRGTEERPDLIVKSVAEGEKLASKFTKEIERVFRDEGLSTKATIDEWKTERFKNLCPDWLDWNDVYRRWFYQDKTISLNSLKKKYSEHLKELNDLDKTGFRDIVFDTMKPLDTLFGLIGNALIKELSGFTNASNAEDVSNTLRADLEELVRDIHTNGTEEDITKLDIQLNRLKSIGDAINAAEGVVFTYKGKLMKLTGSFAAFNQIMGMRRFGR